ncbi:MAG: hypothetical protein ACRCWM_07905 [Sarcina sp.]
MKNIKILATIGLIVLTTSLFSACGKPKITAEDAATQFITATFKEDLRVEENKNTVFELVHSDVEPDESIDYGVDFYESIDEIVKGYTEGLECDKEVVEGFKNAMIENIEIVKKETTEVEETTKVSFDVILHTFDLDNLDETLVASAEKADDETEAINIFLNTCIEEINSKEFAETDTLTVLLEKDGLSWGVTGLE